MDGLARAGITGKGEGYRGIRPLEPFFKSVLQIPMYVIGKPEQV